MTREPPVQVQGRGPKGKMVFGRGKKDIVRPPAPRGLAGFHMLLPLSAHLAVNMRKPFLGGAGISAIEERHKNVQHH